MLHRQNKLGNKKFDFLPHCIDKELIELPWEVTHLDARHIAQVIVDEVVAPDRHKEHRPPEQVGCRCLPKSQCQQLICVLNLLHLLGERHMHPLQRNQNRKNTTELSIMMK